MLARAVTAVGFVLLVFVGFVYLASGLMVPVPWLFGVWAVFAVAVGYAWRQRHRPWHVLATPVVAAVVWVAILSLGDALLGWTA